MSSSKERVGGVEPETVTRLWEHKQSGLLTRHDPQWRNGADQWSEPCEFVPLSALRLVEEELRDWETTAKCSSDALRECEEELRQAREVAHSRLRDRARLVRRAERAEADLDLLIRRFALVSARSGMRAQALQLAEDCITENVANGEGVDSQPAVLDAIFDALKYEIADEPDDARPGAEPPIQSTVVTPVQGEHEQDGEDAGDSTEAVTFHRALCSKCGDSWDGDGLEFASSPERAVETALIEGGLRREDGLLVCDDCRGEIAQDGDTEETT